MGRALELAMLWIVAVWLVLAICSSGYTPYICMGGAMVTVLMFAVLSRRFTQGPRP